MATSSDIHYVKPAQYSPFFIARDSKITVRKMFSHYYPTSHLHRKDSQHELAAWPLANGNHPSLHHQILPYMATIASTTNIAVPTLDVDVDLAWHTHQLTPKNTTTYTLTEMQRFINHDDKIPGSHLSTAVIRTAQLYGKTYCTPYAEWACWYCEATREAHQCARHARPVPDFSAPRQSVCVGARAMRRRSGTRRRRKTIPLFTARMGSLSFTPGTCRTTRLSRRRGRGVRRYISNLPTTKRGLTSALAYSRRLFVLFFGFQEPHSERARRPSVHPGRLHPDIVAMHMRADT
jgi:hypothetical protein